jgi:hypothetical protein
MGPRATAQRVHALRWYCLNYINIFVTVKLPCIVSDWTAWTAVDATGMIYRSRVVLRPPLNVDGECPPLLQSKKGNLRKFILKARIKSSFVLCLHSIMYRLIADCWF